MTAREFLMLLDEAKQTLADVHRQARIVTTGTRETPAKREALELYASATDSLVGILDEIESEVAEQTDEWGE